MYTITKRFEFAAAHQLMGLAPDHQCSRLHGHNFSLEVVLRSSRLDATGFVLDYGKLDFIKTMLDKLVEHRFLNDVFPDLQPSAENLAYHFFHMIAAELTILVGGASVDLLHAVRIKETDKTCAEYSPYLLP